MRVLNWNIRQGGGTRIPEISRHVADTAPDLLVISEFQSQNEAQLRERLAESGLPFALSSSPAPKRNGLLVASRWPLLGTPSALDIDRERWLAVHLSDLNLDLLAIHIPGSPDNKFQDGFGISGSKRKELMWEQVLSFADDRREGAALIVGDFNTGFRADAEGAMFALSHYMRRLIDIGFVDAWRHQHPQTRDYTWYTKRRDKNTGDSADLNGFRLDYHFVSPPLVSAIRQTAILHAPRLAGVSDHASTLLDLALQKPAVQDIHGPSPIKAASEDTKTSWSALPAPYRPADSHAADSRHPLSGEILLLLRRADCHYGNTVRDQEAGWSAEYAARERNVRQDRIMELRSAVRRASNGEPSQNKAQAGHEDGILRALLHFRTEMSEELRQHIDTRLSRLKAEYIPNLKPIPLQCRTRGDSRPQPTLPRKLPCSCGLVHAGECW